MAKTGRVEEWTADELRELVKSLCWNYIGCDPTELEDRVGAMQAEVYELSEQVERLSLEKAEAAEAAEEQVIAPEHLRYHLPKLKKQA